jgi:uncharacterized protein (TIGR03435 family)
VKETGPRQGISTDPGRAQGFAAPIEILAPFLSNQTGRPVLDQTGLAGKYDFVLEWTPDTADLPDPAAAGPAIFTGMQEQLGLRLVAQKGPVQIIVIDRAQKPSENQGIALLRLQHPDTIPAIAGRVRLHILGTIEIDLRELILRIQR